MINLATWASQARATGVRLDLGHEALGLPDLDSPSVLQLPVSLFSGFSLFRSVIRAAYSVLAVATVCKEKKCRKVPSRS